MEPRIGLWAQWGAYLRFSLSLCPSHSALSLDKENKRFKKKWKLSSRRTIRLGPGAHVL